jgi:hypothetical protein
MSDFVTWLMTPLSGTPDHELAAWAYWHARLMTFAWSFALPLGALVARFHKVRPRQDWPRELDDKRWWRTHWRLQAAGVAIATIGLALVYGRGGGVGAAGAHHVLGWTTLVIGWAQVVGALLRGSKGGPTEPSMRGDHYDMTPRRVFFEYAHKTLGWLAMPFAIATTGLGLVIVDAPRWMPIALAAWWLLLIGLFIRWQSAGRCIDTYQAIWGPDAAHPGNTRAPIGWGIVRPSVKVARE